MHISGELEGLPLTMLFMEQSYNKGRTRIFSHFHFSIFEDFVKLLSCHLLSKQEHLFEVYSRLVVYSQTMTNSSINSWPLIFGGIIKRSDLGATDKSRTPPPHPKGKIFWQT